MINLAKITKNSFFEPWDLLFKDFFNNDSFFTPAIDSKPNYPADIYENDNSVTIEVAVAGIDKEDIDLKEDDGVLSISYKKETSEKSDNIKYIQKGIAKRSFCLSWKFSDKFNLNKIEATMDKGILRIVIPKYEEKAKIINTIKIK